MFHIFKNFIGSIKQALEEFEQYKRQLLYRYKIEDYVKVESIKEIRELYYSASKGTICVLDEKHIYVARGKKYEWERYKYDKKHDELVLIFKPDHDDDLGVDEYYKFPPNKKAIKTIKQKDESLLTEEERKALDYHDNNISFYIAITVIAVVGIVIEIIKNKGWI